MNDFKDKTCLLMDMSTPTDQNIGLWKILNSPPNYNDMEVEISWMWELKTKIMPVVVETQGLLKKKAGKFVVNIESLIYCEVKKIALTSTVRS